MTTGALFTTGAALTVITTFALELNALSLAVSFNVYVPADENAAVVEALEELLSRDLSAWKLPSLKTEAAAANAQ